MDARRMLLVPRGDIWGTHEPLVCEEGQTLQVGRAAVTSRGGAQDNEAVMRVSRQHLEIRLDPITWELAVTQCGRRECATAKEGGSPVRLKPGQSRTLSAGDSLWLVHSAKSGCSLHLEISADISAGAERSAASATAVVESSSVAQGGEPHRAALQKAAAPAASTLPRSKRAKSANPSEAVVEAPAVTVPAVAEAPAEAEDIPIEDMGDGGGDGGDDGCDDGDGDDGGGEGGDEGRIGLTDGSFLILPVTQRPHLGGDPPGDVFCSASGAFRPAIVAITLSDETLTVRACDGGSLFYHPKPEPCTWSRLPAASRARALRVELRPRKIFEGHSEYRELFLSRSDGVSPAEQTVVLYEKSQSRSTVGSGAKCGLGESSLSENSSSVGLGMLTDLLSRSERLGRRTAELRTATSDLEARVSELNRTLSAEGEGVRCEDTERLLDFLPTLESKRSRLRALENEAL